MSKNGSVGIRLTNSTGAQIKDVSVSGFDIGIDADHATDILLDRVKVQFDNDEISQEIIDKFRSDLRRHAKIDYMQIEDTAKSSGAWAWLKAHGVEAGDFLLSVYGAYNGSS